MNNLFKIMLVISMTIPVLVASGTIEREDTLFIDRVFFPTIAIPDRASDIPDALRFAVHYSALVYASVDITITYIYPDGDSVITIKDEQNGEINAPVGSMTFVRISLRDYLEKLVAAYGGEIEYFNNNKISITIKGSPIKGSDKGVTH